MHVIVSEEVHSFPYKLEHLSRALWIVNCDAAFLEDSSVFYGEARRGRASAQTQTNDSNCQQHEFGNEILRDGITA